jgi:hypothetical protein
MYTILALTPEQQNDWGMVHTTKKYFDNGPSRCVTEGQIKLWTKAPKRDL